MSVCAMDATGGIAKKVEEAAVIAATGTDVAIALAGSGDGLDACQLSLQQLKTRQTDAGGHGHGQTKWTGTLLRLEV